MATNPNVYQACWKYQAHTTQGQWSIAYIDADLTMTPLRWGCIGTGFHAGYCQLSAGGLRRGEGTGCNCVCIGWFSWRMIAVH